MYQGEPLAPGRYIYDDLDGAVGKFVDIKAELEKLAQQRQGQRPIRPVYKNYQPVPAPAPYYPPYPYSYQPAPPPPPPYRPPPQLQPVPVVQQPQPPRYFRRRPYRRRYYSEDDDAHEIYKISPKFQYRYGPRRTSYKIDESATVAPAPAPIASHHTREQEHAVLKHQRLAAGVSFVALMLFLLFVCCLLPLVYYMCRPKFKKKSGGFSLKGWIKKHLTPKEAPPSSESDEMPDFEKNYRREDEEERYHEPPTIQYPDEELSEEPPKKPTKNQLKYDTDPRKTSLHIQLKETPLEMSISEVEEETEYEYISDMADIGKKTKTKKYRSKSMPSTPVSPIDRLKKRFSFGESSGTSKKGHSAKPPKSPSSKNAPGPAPTPASKAFPFSPSDHPSGTTEEDEEVIYNRYNGKPNVFPLQLS